MNFRFERHASLPPLAWCARVDRGSAEVLVHHGDSVEISDDSFFEGAWDGPFESRDFLNTTVFCGTGAILDGERVKLSSGSDRVSPIFSILGEKSLYASNSLVFAMSAAGEAPDDIYPFYQHDLLKIWRQGLFCLAGSLRLRSSLKLRVHFSGIIAVDQAIVPKYESHPLGEAPTDFASYRAMLADAVKGVIANANDPERTRRFRPVATISTGYDSCATAALAREAGCTEALTFTDSRSSDPRQDSGLENAASLGLACTEYERWQYLRMRRRPEAQFAYLAVGSTPYAAAQEQLRGALLIGGDHGDMIWDPKYSRICAQFAQSWTRVVIGSTLVEYRLSAGFIRLSPAGIGARHSEAIHRIMHSEEMRPWSVGGRYDRTIPRRLSEEAGIPRHQVGTKKMATSHAKLTDPENLSPEALAAYERFLSESHASVPGHSYWYWRAARKLLSGLRRLLPYSDRERVVPSTPMQRRFPFILNYFPPLPDWKFSFTFQWTFHETKHRYRTGDPESGK